MQLCKKIPYKHCLDMHTYNVIFCFAVLVFVHLYSQVCVSTNITYIIQCVCVCVLCILARCYVVN